MTAIGTGFSGFPGDIKFGPDGAMYMSNVYEDRILRIAPDCNNNGINDRCDIDCGQPGGPCDVPSCGQSHDCQPNGIPDECETIWYVDDDAVNDPGPGDTAVSDPLEDGTAEHPFDAIQEAIDAAAGNASPPDDILAVDGIYTGQGNKDLDFDGKVITVQSASGNPALCIIDCQGSGCGFYFHSSEGPDSVVEGLIIRHASSDGVYCDYSSPTLTNCTISGNLGCGLYGSGFNPRLTNCILWADTPEEVYVYSGAPVVTYCDVQGGWPGTGNINADPLFADPDGPDNDPNTWEDNDYRLSAGSPCIDAGDDTAVPPDSADLDGDGDTTERTPHDLDGLPRFVDDPATIDTGVPDPPTYPEVVDLGAYESGAAAAPQAFSTFHTGDGGDGLDGWTVQIGLQIGWASDQGNPAGCLRSLDNDAYSGGKVQAPAKFLGGWTGLQDAGVLRFDMRYFNLSSPSQILTNPIIFLRGPVPSIPTPTRRTSMTTGSAMCATTARARRIQTRRTRTATGSATHATTARARRMRTRRTSMMTGSAMSAIPVPPLPA